MLGKANSNIRPVALGTTVQSSTYGQTIPVIYGRIKSALYLIWEANIRQESGKKTSKKKGKKGSVQYAANVDFLIGHNPILTPLQFWVNQNQKLPLNFVTLQTGIFTYFSQTYTIPDPEFYAVLAITVLGEPIGSQTVNDYGATGPVTFPSLGPYPLWNAAFRGPDPTWPNSLRQTFWYYWVPSMGPNIIFSDNITGQMTIYYAQLFPGGAAQYGKKQSGTDVPVSALRLTFEPVLGDGPEYTGRDTASGVSLATQQIFYPSYAGLGSQDYLSASTGLPEVSAEILGMYNVNPWGDADFCDIIEDVFKQGISQPGFATSSDPTDIKSLNAHQIQHSLGCYSYPGIVNATNRGNIELWNHGFPFPLPNEAGNFLLVFGTSGGFDSWSTVFDDAGNTWNPVIPPGFNGGLWWAQAVAHPALNYVTVIYNPPGIAYSSGSNAIEIAGVDSFDAAEYVVGQKTISITTTNTPGLPCYIFAFADYGPESGTAGSREVPVPGWTGITPANNAYLSYFKIVYTPGTYTFSVPKYGTPLVMGMVSFKATQPSIFPRALTDILDSTTMDLTRNQCRAYGLWGSLVMDSQQQASDWLDILYKAANAAPVWSGFKLKSIPWSEQSYVGNGVIYTSPTSTGPIAEIPAGDFIYDQGAPLYTIDRKAQVDVPNILQIQMPARESDYNDVVITQPMTAAVSLFGSRKESPQQFRCITDPVVARQILTIQANRQNNLRNTFSFKLNAKWKLLEPMDLITLPADPVTNLPAIDVRLTKVEEDEKFQLDCEAQPFVFGTNAPIVGLSATSQQPYQPFFGAGVPLINTPIIFEPVARLLNQQNSAQIWSVVSAPGGQITGVTPGAVGGTGYQVADVLTVVQSGASGGTVTVEAVDSFGAITNIIVDTPGQSYVVANNLTTTGGHGTGAQIDVTAVGASYAGCVVYLSTDGGVSYNNVGTINGNATMGVTVGDWPAANDPDTTNNLAVDLTESQGQLNSYQVQDEDNFNYPCYVSGGNALIPYELMTYALATLTATYKYTLTAVGHHLRRSVFGAPAPGTGVDHPGGSDFAFLGNPGTQTATGIFKLNLDPRWIGTTLYFKFIGFNSNGGGMAALADVTAYTYTPTGTPSGTQNPNNNYVNTPAVALSRTTTTTIHMTDVGVQFPSNKVLYNARTFSISAPATPTIYYVTIADPKQLGEELFVPALTATCQTSNALVGVPGNTYMGFIQVSPLGTTFDLAAPGGWPSPFEAVIGP